jgi:cation transport ATPase
MKKLVWALSLVGVAAVAAVVGARAWGGQTQIEFEVGGVCAMCEFRIQAAAMEVKGVRSAEWDYQTKILTLKVDRSLAADMKPIQEAIAEMGHDTPLRKAADEVYESLPPCCRYR